MASFDMAPVKNEKHAWRVGRAGVLHLQSWSRQGGEMDVDGRTYLLSREGAWRPRNVARDLDTGDEVYVQRGHDIKTADGTLHWRGAGRWRPGWVLADDGHELARFEARGLRQRIHVEVDDGADVPDALIVFCTFLAHFESQKSAAAAGGAAATAGAVVS